MTEVHPFQIACAFRAAEFYLQKPKDWHRSSISAKRYICHAIEEAKSNGRISRDTRDAAISVILERIAPYKALENWAESQGLLNWNWRCDPEEHFRIMQEFRHRWLKKLAREFFAKCD